MKNIFLCIVALNLLFANFLVTPAQPDTQVVLKQFNNEAQNNSSRGSIKVVLTLVTAMVVIKAMQTQRVLDIARCVGFDKSTAQSIITICSGLIGGSLLGIQSFDRYAKRAPFAVFAYGVANSDLMKSLLQGIPMVGQELSASHFGTVATTLAFYMACNELMERFFAKWWEGDLTGRYYIEIGGKKYLVGAPIQ